MKPELFHRWYDPPSDRVLAFLSENGIEHLVDYVDVDDEEEMAISRLTQICGHTEVPTLIVDMEPIMGTEYIINWLKENLLGEHRVARS